MNDNLIIAFFAFQVENLWFKKISKKKKIKEKVFSPAHSKPSNKLKNLIAWSK